MIVFLFNVYLAILFLLVKLRIVTFNLFWKISPAIVFLLLLVGLFIPMNWGAPQGKALVVRNSVAIVPDVAGEVVEVPVVSNSPLKAGDVSPALPFEDTRRVLMVCERSEPAAAATPPATTTATAGGMDREAIRRDLTGRKLDLAARRYLRDLRRAAFIELRI